MAASCENLVIWLKTLDYPGQIESVQDLSNGVILSKILKNICPKVFNEDWQMRIKGDVSNNWRVKASNLKKVLRGVLDYYSQDLQLSLSESQIPDVNVIAEKEDEKEMGKLLQLVLGCAVNCDQKQEYIQKIMGLEEKVQHSVMISIKELMLTESSQSLESECHQAMTIGDQKKLVEERNLLDLRCHELDQQLLILNDEKQNLKAENEKLNQRLNQMDILEDPSTPLGRRMHQLQKQAEHLQEELFKSEAAKDDYRIKCEIMEKEIKQLQSKNELLSKLTEDSRSMKDELDILRHNNDKVAKYEVTISNLRKKLEDLSDLKGQVKRFEEKNSSYIERNLELEEELKKASVYKGQLEVYKRQVHDLQMKIAEENKKVDKYEFDVTRCHEKIAGLQLEKERLIEERDVLKEINEELKLIQSSTSATHVPDLWEGDVLELMGIPPHIREIVMKLQHELKILKSSSHAAPEEIKVYTNLLVDADNRKEELEKELRTQNRKILELEAKIEDLMEMNKTLASCSGAHSTSSPSSSSLSSTSLSSPLARTPMQKLDEMKKTTNVVVKSELAEVSKRKKKKVPTATLR